MGEPQATRNILFEFFLTESLDQFLTCRRYLHGIFENWLSCLQLKQIACCKMLVNSL